MTTTNQERGLADQLDRALSPHAFVRMNAVPDVAVPVNVSAVWRRRTWNTNRAVVMVPFIDAGDHPGEFARNIRMEIGKAVGYKAFFYPVGLQLVMCGSGFLEKALGLEKFVDKIDNQRVVLQSIHAVDFSVGRCLSVRTYGQVVTGRFQDAIELGIRNCLKGFSGVGDPPVSASI